MKATEAREISDRAIYERTGKHLSDLEVKVFLGIWEGKRYEDIATDLGYAHGYIATNVVPNLWALLSDALGERVNKTNLQGAVERYASQPPVPPVSPPEPPPSSEPVRGNILISDRSQNRENNIAGQLREELMKAGQIAVIDKDWLQCSDEELNGYDCFLLLVSSRSADISDVIMAEIRRARQLCARMILLIHVGSPMSLPLNHPLLNHLHDIRQLEWQPTTELPTFVQEVKELLAAQRLEESPAVGDWIALLQNLSMLSGARNWLLTYVGENQFTQLGDLVADLANENGRKIQSGYSYWGLGPVYMWDRACTDPIYHMRENIVIFPSYARRLSSHVDKNRYNFVSLGVGDGNKDRSLIADFFNQNGNNQPREDFLYIPVDMSLDMLRLAIENIPQLPLHSRIAIQRDIETRDGMAEVAFIAKMLGRQQPILYGFIGNTIANVEQPQKVLENIVRVMEKDDLLLFEVQIVAPSVLETERLQDTIDSVRREYLSEPFRRFAESALLQNTDLAIAPAERNESYVVDVSLHDWMGGQLLQIDCFFENNSGRTLDMALLNGRIVRLNPEERIRLYRSRKFTQHTLQNFVEANGLKIIDKSEYLSPRRTGFIVMILQQNHE